MRALFSLTIALDLFALLPPQYRLLTFVLPSRYSALSLFNIFIGSCLSQLNAPLQKLHIYTLLSTLTAQYLDCLLAPATALLSRLFPCAT